MENDDNLQYISGEAHRRNQAKARQAGGKRVTIRANSLLWAVAILVLCGLSFAAGNSYQKHHATSAAVPVLSTSTGGFGSGRGLRGNGSIGQVTAVRDSSITLNDQRTGRSKSYAITSSTAILDNGQSVTAGDIQPGDRVMVSASSSDPATAARILVNPGFGGGPVGSGSQNNSTTQNGATN